MTKDENDIELVPGTELTSEEYEAAITEAVALTTHFYLSKTFYVCRICSHRLSVNYVGKPINERMLDHYRGFHLLHLPAS